MVYGAFISVIFLSLILPDVVLQRKGLWGSKDMFSGSQLFAYYASQLQEVVISDSLSFKLRLDSNSIHMSFK